MRSRARYGLVQGRGRGDEFRGMNPALGQPAPDEQRSRACRRLTPNQVATVTVVCRGVSLSQALSWGNAASANTEIAFALESALKESPLFDAKETQLQPRK